MGILEHIGKWINFKGKPTLKQISLDDLRRVQVAVETELNKLLDENEKIENDDTQLKEEYKAAHSAGRASIKRIIAQKIQALHLKRKGVETRLAMTNNDFLSIVGLIQVQENMCHLEKRDFASIIANTSIGEMEEFILKATVDGTLQMEKLTALLHCTTEGIDALRASGLDSGVDDFMSELDAELLGESAPTNVTAHSEQLDDILKNIDSVAEKGLKASRKIREANRRDGEQVQ